MPTNRAVYLPAKKAPSWEIKPAPYYTAPTNAIVIKNHAVAINPVDYIIQDKGDMTYTWLKYPFVVGYDIAGEVVEVGKGVENFSVGDRVFAFQCGPEKKINDSAQSGFQEYAVALPHLTTKLPNSLSYESASAIPLGYATAAAAMFQKDHLALQYPMVPPKATGKTLIVWGGSTSVGCNAIQLGVAAGYEVFTTCSPKNFELVKRLGAAQAFDYKSNSVVPEMIEALKGATTAGAVAIGRGSAEACMDILGHSTGDKVIALTTFPLPEQESKYFSTLRTVYALGSWFISNKYKGYTMGVSFSLVIGSTIAFNEVAQVVFADFLPKALHAGTFVPAPEVEVFGHGLESIPEALKYHKKGVSAKKVVVTL